MQSARRPPVAKRIQRNKCRQATCTTVGVATVNTTAIPSGQQLQVSTFGMPESTPEQLMQTRQEPMQTDTSAAPNRPSLTRPRQASTARQHSMACSTQQPSLAARRYDPSLPITTNLGSMSAQCTFCQAKRWALEPASLCCCNGKVQLDSLCNPPEPLKTLYLGETCESKHFLHHTRKYNSAFSMTSFGCQEVRESGWNPSFKIQGQVCHKIGSLCPLPNEKPKFTQIYFVDDYDVQAANRLQNIPGLQKHVVFDLQCMLHDYNSYVQSFKSALELSGSDTTCKLVINADHRPTGQHARRYNAPLCNEVAVVLVGEEHGKRDIVLRRRDNKLERVLETHRGYDCMQYPLLFPRGEDGYHFALWLCDPSTGEPKLGKKVSAMNFYAYRLMHRDNDFNIILRGRKVLQQFVVDMYCKIESERLLFIRGEQKKLRADSYSTLRDSLVSDDADPSNVGQRVILPATFTGGPRYMHERTQDALCYVRKHGRPDLFITFTTNPKWDEIQHELFAGQEPHDRPDLIARVFHQKLKRYVHQVTCICCSFLAYTTVSILNHLFCV